MMATQPDPPPDIIEPGAPDELPPGGVPQEFPDSEPPSVDPVAPDIDEPGRGPDEMPPPD